MEKTVGKVALAAQLEALESWRALVLRGILTVGAIAAPMVLVVAIAFRSAPYPWPRLLLLTGASAIFPLLRYAPGMSAAARARTLVALALFVGVLALTVFGFTCGPGIVLAGTGILGVVLLGRWTGLLMIALSVAGFVGVGLLNTRGVLSPNRAMLDPGLMINWVRIGCAFSCLAALLTTAIDYVIRHVEHSSRAATDALHDLRLAYERLALLHERLDAAKEEERRFIASELHDDLGQLLTVIKLRLQMGAGAAETLGVVDQAIDRIRKISRELRPALLDEVGLIPALTAHVETQSELAKVPIELETPAGNLPRLPPALEIACFRIVQESLTNALRHGAPSRITVQVTCEADAVRLVIVDDGRGFDTSTLAGMSAGHLGIAGMQERVRARAGTIEIVSAPGAGTRVEVRLPNAT